MTGGLDVLDALVEGVNIVELDPEDTSVGYGGLPDADGNVTLGIPCCPGKENAPWLRNWMRRKSSI